MNDIIKKLFSRKLWLALAGVTTGVALMLGVESSQISSIAGALISMVSAVVYVVTEGKIDAERVKTAVESTQQAIETIKGADNNVSK
jgi:drug/metabolite transporter (DMT)-like permease